MNFTEHRYTSKDGLSLYYREYGQAGEVIICLPGLTRNSKDFHDLATRLSGRYRILCLDLRGRGQSDHDPKWRHYHPGTYVRDTWKLLDELGINQFIIIGTSLGGLMAMIMSAQQAERIKAIVMNDIGPEIDPVGYARILSYAGIKANVNNWHDAAARCKLISEQAAPGMPKEFWDKFARNTYRENNDGIPELDMDANIGEAIRKGAKTVRLLTKIRKSGIKPDMQRALIPNRGHAPLLDEPESLAAIDSFLENLTRE